MSKSNTAISRRMSSLRPGDVITGLSCCQECNKLNILVLGRQGDGFFDFSLKSQNIGILRDPNGPYRWDERAMCFVNKDGHMHDHIDKTAVIIEGAGLVELGWYRQLPLYGAVRHRISPRGLMGPIDEPGTLAKVSALLEGAQNSDEYVAGVSLAIDMIFAGHEHVVDERRMRLLQALINMAAEVQNKRTRSPGPLDFAAMLGEMGGLGLGDLLSGLGRPRGMRETSFG